MVEDFCHMRFTILNKVFGSGTPPSGNKFAFLAKLREIEYFPKPDSLGVVLLGDIKMKENCGMMQLYITPSSQEYGYEISGDADSKGFKVKFTGTHPGTEQQALEFATNYLEEEFIILIPDCKKGVRVLGTPDVPLIFTSTHKSTKDAQKFNFVFEQEVATDFIYHLYDGIVTLNENIDIDMSSFLEALRYYIKIDGSNLSEAQKQNLRDILGVGGSNIANSDLSLSENRSLNLKNYFLNFFSNSGKAKVGINKNNPDKALEVVGGANIDALVLGQNNETNALSREGNIIYINTLTGKKKLVQESDFVMDDYGIIQPDTAVPVGGWAIGWYTPGTSSVDPGTNYPNQDNLKAIDGKLCKFYFNNTTWQKVEVELPSNAAEKVFNPLDDEKASTMKAGADRWDVALTVLDSFVRPQKEKILRTLKYDSAINAPDVVLNDKVMLVSDASQDAVDYKVWGIGIDDKVHIVRLKTIQYNQVGLANLIGDSGNGFEVLLKAESTAYQGIKTFDFDIRGKGFRRIDVSSIKMSEFKVDFIELEGDGIQEDSVNKKIQEIALSADSRSFGNKTEVSLEKPRSLARINLLGVLPTDTTDAREKTVMQLEYIVNNRVLFKTNVENKIQGASTALFDKKNWNIKILNDNNERVKIKWGNWFPDSSIHLKAFVGDLTMARDTAGARLYGQILNSRPFPQSFNAKFPQNVVDNDNNLSNFFDDSSFYLDGFPIELYINGNFHGLYIARQRRENENYRMNSANKKNIYLANDNDVGFELSAGFQSQYWEVKSPKMTGYSTQQPVTDTAVLSDINRLFDWFVGLKNTTVDFEATAPNYINIQNWVDCIIFCQLVQNWDFYVNNQNLCTYDGLTWYLHPTDLNWTVGLGDIRYPDYKHIEAEVKKLHWRGVFFKDIIYPKLLTRIKARYVELKANGVIDLNNLNELYKLIPATIGSKLMIAENNKWYAPETENKGIQSVQYFMQFFMWKIEYLDSIWS